MNTRPAVTLEVVDGIAVLTFDLPGESVNKFSPAVIDEFTAHIDRIEKDTAIKGAVLHPVSLPAMAGLLFAQTGLTLPEVVDKPIEWLGKAFSPIALLMVGLQLQRVLGQGGWPWQRSAQPQAVPVNWQEVMHMVVLKNLLHPLLILAGGWWLGLPALPMTVMLVTACMPVGANSFLFATRYQVAEAEVSVSLSLSVICAMVTVPLMLALQTGLLA